jgi:hypothetical protein
MILRIARFTVPLRHEAEIVDRLRSEAAVDRRPDGLEDLIFAAARPKPGMVEYALLTLWTDPSSMRIALRAAARTAGDLGRPLAVHGAARVEHFDVIADDWPEIARLLEVDGDEQSNRARTSSPTAVRRGRLRATAAV